MTIDTQRTARLFSHLLLTLVAWTISIKYVAPILVAWSSGVPWSTHVMWDAWPLAHLLLAFSLRRGGRSAVILGMGIATAEVIVVLAKFAMFLRTPVFDPWRAQWFTNKLFVLGLFIAMLVWLSRRDVRQSLGGTA